LGGSNNIKNLVLLTPKEHYICHKLLVYIYTNNKKMVYALFYMTFNKKYNIISARSYAYAKKIFSETPISEETKIKLSIGHKNQISLKKNKTYEEIYGVDKANEIKNKLKKPKTEEHKRKLSISEKNKIPWNKNLKNIYSVETKLKMSVAHSGTFEEVYGIEKAKEMKEKISKVNKGKKRSESTKQKMRKPKSLEHRKNMSKSAKNHLVSKETKEKISKANKGRILTEEQKRKISKSLKANKKTKILKNQNHK
jgi:hypothetical protein